jgi:GNAT superfamily N-acetyltransferase
MSGRGIEGVRLRTAGENDAELLADAIAASFADVAARFGLTRENCPAHASFVAAGDIRYGMKLGSTFVLAEDGGCVCGCVGFRPPRNGFAVMEKLAVLPPFRRRGLGRALMEHAAAAIRGAGGAGIEIGIVAEHEELRAWYERNGFRFLRKARFDHLPFGVVYMRRTFEDDGGPAR